MGGSRVRQRVPSSRPDRSLRRVANRRAGRSPGRRLRSAPQAAAGAPHRLRHFRPGSHWAAENSEKHPHGQPPQFDHKRPDGPHCGTRGNFIRGLVFPSPDGGPIRRTSWVRRFWKPGLASAGLDKDLGTHTLRHSQVALLIAQGEHPKVIADRLGHTSVRTVLDVYGHLNEGADQAAAEALDKQIASYPRPERVQHTVIELPQPRRNPR